jgi:hypothetical protein
MDDARCISVTFCLSRALRYDILFQAPIFIGIEDWDEAKPLQKFVGQLTMIPNLKIDYVVLNAGVLRYPNVIFPTAMHNRTPR